MKDKRWKVFIPWSFFFVSIPIILLFSRLVVNLIRPIITSLLLVYVRIRIINTIFLQKKLKIYTTLKVFWIAIVIVGSLFAYNYLLWALGQNDLILTNIINTKTLSFFVAYCTLTVVIVTIFLKNRYRRILQILLIWSLFFAAIAYGGLLTGINVLLLYYIVSAYAEEYMKYSAGNNLFLANKETNDRNLIIFCIMIGLGFSAVENILYIINNIITNNNVHIVSMLVGRGLISTLIHIVATSLIAFIMIKSKRKDSIIVPAILWIIWGFGLHSIYNISLQYHLTYITIPLIIMCFFMMTYLTFQTDLMYKPKP